MRFFVDPAPAPPKYFESRTVRRFAWWPKWGGTDMQGRSIWLWLERYCAVDEYGTAGEWKQIRAFPIELEEQVRETLTGRLP